VTVDELFQECYKEHWSQERYVKSGHEKEVLSKYKNHIKPAFGDLDYLKITRAQIRDWHRGFIKIPVTGNRCKEIMSKLYSFSMEKEFNQSGFNPCQAVKKFTERKRKRFASETELKRLGEVFEKFYVEHPLEITFIYALFYSGSRPRALERARWTELQELDGGVGLLTFDGKSTAATGDEETVLLPSNIMEMIKSLPRRSDGLIFGIKSPTYLWRKIRIEANVPDLWCRDSRRTFATVGFSGGVNVGTVGKLLNHHSPATTDRYAQLNRSAGLEASDKIKNKFDSIFGKK
jgi:integrase